MGYVSYCRCFRSFSSLTHLCLVQYSLIKSEDESSMEKSENNDSNDGSVGQDDNDSVVGSLESSASRKLLLSLSTVAFSVAATLVAFLSTVLLLI